MTLLQVMAIRDRAIPIYEQPFTVRSVQEGIRGFVQIVNDKQTKFNAHPEDYDLYLLGTYDQDTGAFNTEGGPRQIAIGKDVLKPQV